MRTLGKTRASWLWPLTFLLSVACATKETKPEPTTSMETSVTSISERLVSVAELRTDLRSIRTCIHTFQEEPSAVEEGARRTAASAGADGLGHALEQEFMLALANRIYVLDAGLDDDERTSDSCSHAGASHVLIGNYVLRGEELELSVRLVETDSHVIVAATRGYVPVPPLAQPRVEAGQGQVAGTPGKSEVVSTAPPPVEAPEVAVASVPGQAPPANPVLGEDFEARRARKLQEPEPEEVPPPVLPVRAQPPVEDFETWRRRELEEEGYVVPPGKAPKPAELASTSEEETDSSFPWRNPKLDELLGIAPGTPSVGPDPGRPQPVSSYPWRTEKLAELLRVKK